MPAARTLDQVRSEFVWDKDSLRYRRASTGRFVKADDVRAALRRVVDASRRAVTRLAASLNNGTIGVGAWQAAMERAVKDMHLAATAAGKGGFGAMTARDYGLAGARLRLHYEALERFARDVEAGRITPARTRWRAELYAKAAVGVYENSRREAAQGVMTHERRVLGVAEHCRDCIAAAALGWQPLGTLPRIGQSICRAACKCRFRFKKVAA